MKRIRKLIAVAALCTLAVSAMGCKMIEKTPEAVQRTVYATVGDEKITKADMDEEMQSTINQLKQQYGDDVLQKQECHADSDGLAIRCNRTDGRNGRQVIVFDIRIDGRNQRQ